jgi:hypothetical protein
MALGDKMHLYLRLERLMIELDDQGDPFAEKLRDLMDPLWFSLSKEEHEFLDSRGEVEVRTLYPITLAIDNLFQKPSEVAIPPVVIVQSKNGVGKQFAIEDAIPCAA